MGKRAHAGLVHADQLHERLAVAVAGRPHQRRVLHPPSPWLPHHRYRIPLKR